MVQNYEKDNLNYVNQNNPKSQETLFNIMNELDIHDNWRIQKGGKVFGNLTIVYFQILDISIKSKRLYKKY